MKSMYLHIGMPKTGSTSIQFFCTENIETFKKHGIFYPTPCNENKNHVDITSSYFTHFGINNKGIFSTRKNEFEISNCHTAVLSSEFCIIDDVDYYKTLVEDYNYKYIVYLRSPILFAESEAYSTSFFYTLDYFGINEADFKIFPYQYDFDFTRQFSLLANFSKNNYKNNNFILKSFDKIIINDDLLKDFCQTIGITDYTSLKFTDQQNISLKTDYAFFLAHTNMLPLSYAQRVELTKELSLLSVQDKDAKKYRVIPDEVIKSIPIDIINKYNDIGEYIGDPDFWYRGYYEALQREFLPYKELPYDKQIFIFNHLPNETQEAIRAAWHNCLLTQFRLPNIKSDGDIQIVLRNWHVVLNKTTQYFNEKISYLEQKVDILKNQNTLLKSSISWKITKPLRIFYNFTSKYIIIKSLYNFIFKIIFSQKKIKS